jgi:hypothetical protein
MAVAVVNTGGDEAVAEPEIDMVSDTRLLWTLL